MGEIAVNGLPVVIAAVATALLLIPAPRLRAGAVRAARRGRRGARPGPAAAGPGLAAAGPGRAAGGGVDGGAGAGRGAGRRADIRRIGLPVIGVLAAALLCGLPAWAALLAGAGVLPVLRWSQRRVRPPRPEEMSSAAAVLDLFAACLDAGLSAAEALVACPARSDLPPSVRDALGRCAALISLGGDAALAWRPVADHPLLAPLAAAAIRSDLGGIRLAGAAREMAVELRARCRQAGDGAAARAGVAMTAPLALCFLPAFLCLGLAPVIIGLVTDLHIW